ncbi:Uncharacterised protein [uncultured archaeon]|nr:Uncharacterised protein [uncultured archaeon]
MSSVKRKKWDGTRIPRITRIGTDVSVDIRQIRVIRVLTDDQWSEIK